MKIIVVGYTSHPSQNTVRIGESFKRQNHQVVMVDFGVAEKQLGNIKYFNPDLLFVTMGRSFDHQKLLQLKDKGVFLIQWLPDEYPPSHPAGQWLNDISGVYDLLLVETSGIIDELKCIAKEVLWTPQYFDDHYHTPLRRNLQFDIGFLGGTNTEQSTIRKAFLQQLIYDGYNLVWKGFDQQTMLVGQDMCDFYSKCKLTINFVNDKISTNPKHFELAMSNRVFKALGCGCLVITHKIEGMERLGLIDGQNIIIYESTNYEDLRNKIDYFLSHSHCREKIEQKGQKNVLTNYNIDKVVKQWLDIFEERK